MIEEQEEWRRFVARNLGKEARLIYVAPTDSDRRVYRVRERMAKVQRSSNGRNGRPQSLEAEYAVLTRLRYQPEFDRHPEFVRRGEWEVLWYDFIDGEPLPELWRRAGWFGKLGLARRAARSVSRLHRAGVAHVDMQGANYLGEAGRDIRPIDFGDSVIRTPRSAAGVDVRRFLLGRYGLAHRIAKRVFLRVWPNSQRLYRSFKLKRVPIFVAARGELSDCDGTRLLESGWRQAARWNTTAGQWLAYSSLTIGGIHFPGWRPWLLRWSWIREVVSFEGKDVLDLGCSMGLFCSFALLEGARSALGVDVDAPSLDAAQLIAAGLGVRPTFKRLQIGGSDDWPTKLPSADIVAAMSIAEWVEDQQKFFDFLGRAPELIYEGHDSVAIEHDRLRGAGFRSIEILAVTERNRVLFRATK